MKYKYINKYVLSVLILLVGFVLYLQYSVSLSTQELKEQEIDKTKAYASKIVHYIKRRVPSDLDKSLSGNEALQEELNRVLHAFMTDKYKYIFVLDRVNDNYYRFLLDGSIDFKADFHSIFIPKSSLYDEVYDKKTIQVIRQKDSVENVWISILVPIVYQNKSEALLVLDLSKNYCEYLESFNSPLVDLIDLMQFFLVVSILILATLLYRYYIFRKKFLKDTISSAYSREYLDEFFSKNSLNQYHALLIDIDEFRVINSKYGYSAGNRVLEEFVSAIRLFLSEYHCDLVFRIGGGEFVVVIKKDLISINEITKGLFIRLKEKRYFINDEIFQIKLSMSAMEIPNDVVSWYKVLRFLDEKLLDIKKKGKNNFAIIDKTSKNDLKYSDIDYIKDRLENEDVKCIYQPIFYTKERKIAKFETLVRLYDVDDDRDISPYFFMGKIRGTSQYLKLSRIVFKEIFKTLESYPDIELSVNLNLDDLYNQEMLEMLDSVLSKHHEYAHRLTFEILEDQEIFDYNVVNEAFNRLRYFGSKIAIDDFGSGYANYIYLIKLNVDFIKIDATIVKELLSNPQKSKEVIKSIKDLANRLDAKVIVEHVSTKEIYQMMIDLDIEYSQGFYLGEPKNIREYLD